MAKLKTPSHKGGTASFPQGEGRRRAERTHSVIYVDPKDRAELGALLSLTDAKSDLWLWRVTNHLLFGTTYDEDSGALLIDHRTLGAITGQSHNSGSFSAYEHIEKYQLRTGIKLSVSLPDALAGKARAVESMEVPSRVTELVSAIRRTRLPISERVALDTGLRWTTDIRDQQRLFTREEALARAAGTSNPDALRLLRLLNDSPPNRWSALDDHIPFLRSVAEGLDGQSREYALNVLARIEVQPKPFFTPVERSCRVYGIGTTLLSLPREVRKALVQAMNWVSLDLRQAQLAVVARLWDVPSLQALLQERASFWTEILAALGLEDECKPFIKNLAYGLVFGEGESKAKARFLRQFGAEGARLWELWRGHPIVMELWDARSRTIKEYQNAGGAEDAYGRTWTIQGRSRTNAHGDIYTGTNTINILATVAQSYELKLLSPVIDILERSAPRVRLQYWLHDGFTLSLPDNRSRLVDRMKESVAAEARRLGIITCLDEE